MHMFNRTSAAEPKPAPGASYKFQRTRERLREAVMRGEFATRLPGERVLARQFGVNAKTINKAISDLCAEGLLQRHIGQGTFLADRPDTPRGHGTFVCLTLPASDAAGSPLPPPADHLGRLLRSQEHGWETPRIIRPTPAGTIPLHAWPAPLRHRTSGLLCCPASPLSSMAGRFSEELILEAVRRQVPVVTLGAAAGHIRLAAVVPDYVDAGFRIGDYLYRAGCRRVIVLRGDLQSREVALVVGGCQAAAERHRGALSELAIPLENRAPSLAGRLNRVPATPDSSAAGPVLGLVCVGGPAVRAALADPDVVRLRVAGRLLAAAVVEPGNPVAELARLTSYEVEIAHLATWTARLLLDRRGARQQPTEILVPGVLRVRPAVAAGGSDATGSSRLTTMGGVGTTI